MWIGVVWLRIGTSWGASEENNERFDSMRGRGFIGLLNDCQLQKKNSAVET
jgi:hypothetical protein